MCTDGILLDAVEDENTHKPETLPLGSLYWEEREKKISSVHHAGKKAQQGGFGNRRDDFWSEVLRMSFKEERRQWTRPWRKDRHKNAETKVDGWTVFFPDTGTIMGQVDWSKPGSSLRAGWYSFPCLLLHLRALALYMTSNRHTVDDSLKLNTNETKFRAWLGDHPMVWFVKTTGWDQGENELSWHGNS